MSLIELGPCAYIGPSLDNLRLSSMEANMVYLAFYPIVLTACMFLVIALAGLVAV